LLVQIHVARGELEEAAKLMALFSSFEEAEDLQSRAVYAAVGALCRRAEGRAEEALPIAVAGFELTRELSLSTYAVREAFVEAVEAAFDLGDLETVEELLAIVGGLLPGEMAPSVGAHLSRFGARLAALRHLEDEVEPGFKMAAGTFRELAMPFWMAVTLLEHGEWLGGAGRTGEAGPFLDEAAETFGRLGARPWLERLPRGRARGACPAN